MSHRWEPLSVASGGCSDPPSYRGGSPGALDLHLGRRTRAHEDIDVQVLRPHLPDVRSCLGGWDLYAAEPSGTLRPLLPDEIVPPAVHDVWCRPGPGDPWQLQLMIGDVAEDDPRNWVYRRDYRICRPWRSLSGPASTSERAVLAPEVQLLYKSKDPRPKDLADFSAVVGHLSHNQRRWLVDALRLTAPITDGWHGSPALESATNYASMTSGRASRATSGR